ncbi:hypothetical protein BXZ70DRAFT_663512 [Cristinia sonorae]|uniref:Hemerythrin-like domain-containing protein n=1 Tax=Cristinia sonorae TaxID=1940300 RepID=A0A8K0UUC7_9AGAR|nr:hypothetical protein BXZ70DRAFT_663512 [Cristinia sonorae]
MPAPYPLLKLPPGDFSNMFDFPAINMAAAHNMFIQSVNAMYAHAAYVKDDQIEPFITFCLTAMSVIHHHHRVEETFYFSALEEKLGKGYLDESSEEHAQFVPQMEVAEKWLEDVRDGKEVYNGEKLMRLINTFADKMIEHLTHEVEKLDRTKIRECFTEKELKDIDSQFMKIAFQEVNMYTQLPISVVCGNPETPWFPPFPTPLKWAIRYWFVRRYRAAWEFGPLDIDGKPKGLPTPPELPPANDTGLS